MSGFDNMSIDSGPDSEFNFQTMENKAEDVDPSELKDIDSAGINPQIPPKRVGQSFRRRLISGSKRGTQISSK
jgi:hypothetical protein